MLIFPIAGRLSDRLSPGLLIGSGLALFAWSSWLTAGADVRTDFCVGRVYRALLVLVSWL